MKAVFLCTTAILAFCLRCPAVDEVYRVLTSTDGKEIKGVTLNEDSFSLQLMDTSEQIHLLEKNKLRSIHKSRKSLMPSYDSGTLTDQDLNDIIAYLQDVAAK